jgi:protein regulator of cytokinesis 1
LSPPNRSIQDDNSLLLLPPSQTISESLNALALSTSEELEKVWDEVGCSPEDRADQLTDLLSGFRKLCEEKIEAERMTAQYYKETIVTYKEEIRAKSEALSIEVDETLLADGGGQSLSDEAMTLEVTLDKVRSIADIASADLSKCRDLLLGNYEALGLTLEECWQDITSDLTQSRRDEFHNKVKEMEEVVFNRKSAVEKLLKDCQALLEALDCDIDANELDHRIMNSLNKDDEGNYSIQSTVQTDTCTGISSSTLEDLTDRLRQLNQEKKQRKAKLNEMGADIGALWEKLHVSKEDRSKFADSIHGLGMDTIEKGEKELIRLYELRADMMGKLIVDAREKIDELLKETNSSDEQKASFSVLGIEDEAEFNEELLNDHEQIIESLESRLAQMRPMLDMIEKREVIVLERMQYEGFQKDPDRLQQRGAALTKQLMKEEKMSRRIKKDLPKYTEVLQKKLKEWVNTHGEPFLFKGDRYTDVMQKQEDEWQQYKDNQTKRKLQKKQEEKTTKHVSGAGKFQPLPGKKKVGAPPSTNGTSRGPSRTRAISRGRTFPLGDKTNHTRAVSRGRANQEVRKARATAPTGYQKKSASSNATSKGARGMSRTRPRPLTR